MKFGDGLGRAAVSVAVVLAIVVGASAAYKLKAQPTATGVADVQEIFDALKEKDQIEGELKDQLESLNQEEQDRKNELQALKSDMDILAPGTPAFNEKQAQLEQKAIELQAWRNYQNQRLNRERGLQIERLYRKVTETIGSVAQQNGYDIVMFKERPVDFTGAKPEALKTLIQVRKVLWADESLDLTDQVIQMMNNDYSNLSQ